MAKDQHLTAKELARRALDYLPDDADIGEVIQRILFLHTSRGVSNEPMSNRRIH